MPLDEHRLTNLRNWEDRVPVHAASQTYNLAGLAADPQRLSGVVSRDRDRPRWPSLAISRLRPAPTSSSWRASSTTHPLRSPAGASTSFTRAPAR